MHIAHQSVSVMVSVSVHTVLITDRWMMMTVMLSECVYTNCLTLLISSSCSTVLNLFDDLQLQNVNEYVHVPKQVLIIYVVTRVARHPVFYGSSRISAQISRLPGRSYTGDEISRISVRTCQSPVTCN